MAVTRLCPDCNHLDDGAAGDDRLGHVEPEHD